MSKSNSSRNKGAAFTSSLVISGASATVMKNFDAILFDDGNWRAYVGDDRAKGCRVEVGPLTKAEEADLTSATTVVKKTASAHLVINIFLFFQIKRIL
mmetsp:Transcript_409/g.613  ORF Transcript_409/g.613 Transcript_409/m.613 type:complete len:98 (-) Transcript_409:131-424(-)